ncbi:MAG: class I SAM-dependent methyltransferase, partial [Candidatus Eremiobacteraeota bacterium]|nr:class I SAM-dependent methyltransferase [Candidatus Eremiobacteraeota bacterium]
MDERKLREQEFHDSRFGAEEARKADRFYAITAGSYEAYRTAIFGAAPGRRILEYGCGPGSASFELAALGANVSGIDISPVAIDLARSEAHERRLAIDFQTMDAERLSFDDATFDVVCGSGILHHLDLERAYAEISRVLRPDGVAFFSEPLGHNPVINAYRDRTPDQRTPDEHPLLVNDFRAATAFFSLVEVRYYHLATLAALPFCNKPYIGGLSRALDTVDRLAFT